MGRKIKFDKNCGSKFITIDDEKKWELIREIATVKRYESSFNAIVNDALAFGLPELHKRLFDKVQLDGEEKAVSVPKEYSVDAFYFELIRLMKEIIANQPSGGETTDMLHLQSSLVMGGRNAVGRKFQERISERHAGLHRERRSKTIERSGEVNGNQQSTGRTEYTIHAVPLAEEHKRT